MRLTTELLTKQNKVVHTSRLFAASTQHKQSAVAYKACIHDGLMDQMNARPYTPLKHLIPITRQLNCLFQFPFYLSRKL